MASRGINKVILVGNVGRDPEIKSFANGESVASISVATSESWRDKNTGETREKNEWHRVSVFGNTASFVANYVRKGSQLYVEGQLQTRKWQDQNGQDRYTTEIVVRWPNGSVQLMGNRGHDTDVSNLNSSSVPAVKSGIKQPANQSQNVITDISTPNYDDFDDDIPF